MVAENFVTYEDFGAVGDGLTNDYAAIYRAHEYANEKNLRVKGRTGAHYYIGDPTVDGEVRSAVIKTSVDWCGARFTIDNSIFTVEIEEDPYRHHTVFQVQPDYPMLRIDDAEILSAITDAGLGRGTKKINLRLGYSAMIVPYDSAKKVFCRRGYGDWRGSPKHEIIVIDGEGNVSDETPIMFEYDKIDYIEVYRFDTSRAITIENGIFTTVACKGNNVIEGADGKLTTKYRSDSRGMKIMRSYTTLKNIKHFVVGETTLKEQVDGDGKIINCAPNSSGFYFISNANHITLDGCVMTGRRCYPRPQGGTIGTYDFFAIGTNKIVLKDCTQSNFWVTVDPETAEIKAADEHTAGAVTSMSTHTVNGTPLMMHWGIGGSNFCKNMEYIGCTLSRFDAHCGLYNGKILDSTINGMEIIGIGKLELENSRWFARGGAEMAGAGNSLFYLRGDYGSTWEGEISVKNFDAYIGEHAFLFYHQYNNWNYGYRAHFPSLSIENIRYFDKDTRKLLYGKEITLLGPSIDNEPQMNSTKTLNTPAAFPDLDLDGDGLVDGTDIPYDDVVSPRGVVVEGCMTNLNQIVPPGYIKITGNEKYAHRYIVKDTSECTDGGFFGSTEFISDEESCIGTSATPKSTFVFKK